MLPGAFFSKNCGNCYTASVFGNMLAILCNQDESLIGKRIFMFSYGSGSVSSIYSFMGRTSTSQFSLQRIKDTVRLSERLECRRGASFDEFTHSLAIREETYGVFPLQPSGDLGNIGPGVFYLEVRERS